MLSAIFSQGFFFAGDPWSIFEALTEARSSCVPLRDLELGGRGQGGGVAGVSLKMEGQSGKA